jgi:hypothetical protein
MGKYEELAKKVGQLVDEKNKAYGNSFADVGDFLRILYPDGVSPENYTDMLCVVRIFDKLKRIATKKDAFGESPYRDLAGYALLGLLKDEETKEKASVVTEKPTTVEPVTVTPTSPATTGESMLARFKKTTAQQ